MNQSSDRQRNQSVDEHLGNIDVAGLVGRMLDDLVRIAETQAKLMEVNISETLSSSLDRAVGRAVAAVMYLIGGLCLLGAIIVLLRRHLSWWEALVIAGSVTIVAGFAVQWITARSPARRGRSQFARKESSGDAPCMHDSQS